MGKIKIVKYTREVVKYKQNILIQRETQGFDNAKYIYSFLFVLSQTHISPRELF